MTQGIDEWFDSHAKLGMVILIVRKEDMRRCWSLKLLPLCVDEAAQRTTQVPRPTRDRIMCADGIVPALLRSARLVGDDTKLCHWSLDRPRDLAWQRMLTARRLGA